MIGLQVLTCSVALAIAAPVLADQVRTVDCSRSTIGRVLENKEDKAKPLVLRIRGTCAEHVTVDRDDVTLEGDGAGVTINGSITIDTGRRAVVSNLTVTNATGDGVTVVNGGSATIRDSNMVDNGGYGVSVRNAAFALAERNVLSRNGRTDTQASGIFVGTGSMVRGLQNVMEGNANAGIEVGDSATYRSEGDAVTSFPSGRASLDIYRAGFVDVRGVTATGLVDVNQQSQLQVRNVAGFPGSTITGNIAVGPLSLLRLRTGVVHTGTRNCTGALGFFTNLGNLSACQIDP